MLIGPSAASPAADFIITYHGTRLNDACLSRVEGYVAFEPRQRLGKRGVCIDPALAEELREALTEAGFTDGDTGREGPSI